MRCLCARWHLADPGGRALAGGTAYAVLGDPVVDGKQSPALSPAGRSRARHDLEEEPGRVAITDPGTRLEPPPALGDRSQERSVCDRLGVRLPQQLQELRVSIAASAIHATQTRPAT
uniref:Uncharacterized protein n=1 Tax=Alexandrium monilatum TaxID=311494 RepID=A0A7S4PST4_9DINO